MSFNNSATIFVTNNTGGNANIAFSHQYSDDPVQVWPTGSTQPIAPGAAAGPLEVGWNTGFLRTGQDTWYCAVQVLDGPSAGSYATEGTLENPTKQCTLESSDNGSTLTFSVTTEIFVMTENSGSCSTSMSAASAIAAMAQKQPKNAQPQAA